MTTLAVITTLDDRDKARSMADELVARGLAACAQISEIESVYVWQGATQHDREFRLLLKTTDTRYAELETAIRDLHDYDLPAIHAFPVARVYTPYANWVEEQTSGG